MGIDRGFRVFDGSSVLIPMEFEDAFRRAIELEGETCNGWRHFEFRFAG